MKKSTIVSIVLALMLAANAAASATPAIAKKKSATVALKKDMLFRRNHNNDNKKKRDEECEAVTCLDEGDTCDNDDDTSICKDDFYCVKNKCAKLVEGGDCDDGGYCYDNLYCDDDSNTCTHIKSEGEPCSDDSECKYYLVCNESYDDEMPRVCIQYPEKVGDSCSVHSDYCPLETKCVYGVCTTYPTTVGADCDENAGCDNNLYCNSEHKCAEYPKAGDDCLNGKCADYHYCDDGSGKCVKYPGEGEDCHDNYYCDNGLYCDRDENKCVKKPGLGEECDYSGCASGLVCDYYQKICYNEIAGEGEYCSNSVSCGDGLVCDSDNSVCIPGECGNDDDCPIANECHNFKCIDFMSFEDGEECNDGGSFSCKEGSGCGRNESSSTGYSCMKITTKLSEERVCEDDDDCPSDSYCDCNWVNGKTQCIPYFVANKTMLKYYKKLLTLVTTGEYLEYTEEFNTYRVYVARYTNPGDGESYCYAINYTILEGDDSSSHFSSDSSYSSNSSSSSYISDDNSSSSISVSSSDSEGIASNMKPSVALSAVLFVFGLIAAML